MYYPRLKDLREDNDLKQKEIAAFLELTSGYTAIMRPKREIPGAFAVETGRILPYQYGLYSGADG